jgi:hypothetical protein
MALSADLVVSESQSSSQPPLYPDRAPYSLSS